MRARIIAMAMLVVLLSMAMIPMADAQDVNYTTPPAADTTLEITMTNLKSDDPTQYVVYDSSSDPEAYFLAINVFRADHNHSGYSYTESHCLPSWISWSVAAKNDYYEAAKMTIAISPALQQVSEDTHGDYWIHFNVTYPNVFSSEQMSILIKIHLDVKWNGSVIVQDNVYHTYALIFDSLGGSVSQTYYYQVLASEDTGMHYFDTTSVNPSKDGYRFKGWSTTNGDTQPSDVSDEFPIIAQNADNINSSNPMNIVYTKTIYAIWEEATYQDLPDMLRDIVSLLANPAVLAILFVLVIAVAYVVRIRRLGMWGMRR